MMSFSKCRLEQLHLIGGVAAEIGHIVRNPMTTVRGFAQILGDKPELAKHKEIFELMIAEIDNANAIITDFLVLAKDKMIKTKRTNLNELIRGLLPLLKSEAAACGQFIETELGEIPELFIDEREIVQLILNLARNGLEAMNTEGQLTIITWQDGGKVILLVADQGEGIQEDNLKKVGLPFFTTKEGRIGLGMAACCSIIARNNAVIEIHTNQEGTTVCVKFNLPVELPG